MDDEPTDPDAKRFGKKDAGDSHIAKGWLEKTLTWIVSVDPDELHARVDDLRSRYPSASNAELARRVFSGARWKAGAVGVVTGLPPNLAASAGAAGVDVGVVLRIEAKAAAQVALIYDAHFFDDENAEWELLVPLFGLDAISQFGREAGVRAGMGITRHLIRSYLSKGSLKTFKRIMLKYFGLKVTQRAIITKTVPIVGGVIGGTWNFAEVSLLRKRCIAYFEGKEVGDSVS